MAQALSTGPLGLLPLHVAHAEQMAAVLSCSVPAKPMRKDSRSRIASARPYVHLDDGERGHRSPGAACDGVVAPHPTAFAIVRYEGLPAALRSCRSSWANQAIAPADGSTGLPGRPMGSYLRPCGESDIE